MDNNTTSNTSGVEEVPLDLFNQVTLNDYKPEENEPVQEQPKAVDPNVPKRMISIPANAYKGAIEKEKQAAEQKENVQANITPVAETIEIIDIQ